MKKIKSPVSFILVIVLLCSFMFGLSACDIDPTINVYKKFTIIGVWGDPYTYNNEKYITNSAFEYRKLLNGFSGSEGYFIDESKGITQIGYTRDVYWLKMPVYVSDADTEQNILMTTASAGIGYVYLVKEGVNIPDKFDCNITSLEAYEKTTYRKGGESVFSCDGLSFRVKDIISEVSVSIESDAREERIWFECVFSEYDYLKLRLDCVKTASKIYLYVYSNEEEAQFQYGYYEVIDEEYIELFNQAFEAAADTN